MKSNLPAVLTSKKIWTLFLLTSSNVLPVETGSEFRKCVGDVTYQGIINYADKDSGVTNYGFTYCCLSGGCSPFPCPFSEIDVTFQCTKIGQSTFCITVGSSATGDFGGLCGGILNDKPLTNVSVPMSSICSNSDIVINTLIKGPTTNSTFT